MERFQKQIEFILEIDKLKHIYRQSILVDGSREENDAEHSWHLAMMAIVLQEYANDPKLDLLKVIKMVLIHDIVEIDAGDTFVYDTLKIQDKTELEKKAADRIFGILPDDQKDAYIKLWEEFETRVTSEAKFAAVLDRFEPLLLNTKTKGHTWKKHGISSQQVYERNQHTQEGSRIIWTYIKKVLDECIEQGLLAR